MCFDDYLFNRLLLCAMRYVQHRRTCFINRSIGKTAVLSLLGGTVGG